MVCTVSARGSESDYTAAGFPFLVSSVLGIYWFMGAAVVGVAGTFYTRFTFHDAAAELGFAAGLRPEVSRPRADCQGRGSTGPPAGAQAWLVLVGMEGLSLLLGLPVGMRVHLPLAGVATAGGLEPAPDALGDDRV